MRKDQKDTNNRLRSVMFFMKKDTPASWRKAATEAKRLLEQIESGGLTPHLSPKTCKVLLRGYLRYVASLGGA